MWKNCLGLWILLVVSFGIFLVVDLFSPVKLFGHEIASSGMAEALFGTDQEQEADEPEPQALSADSLATDSLSDEQPVLEVDTAAQRLLLIGDSMLEGLSPRLAAYAKENGHKLFTVIWYSSTSQVWGECQKLRECIMEYRPTFVFICLGANELFVKNITVRRAKYVKEIISQIGDLPYLWIGPPNWKEDTGINSLIEANARQGGFFLSNGMSFDRTSDGAHPTRRSACEWMDSVVRWMPENSFHPIRLEKPQASTAKPDKLVLLQPKTVD